jgi:hypothetical protein
MWPSISRLLCRRKCNEARARTSFSAEIQVITKRVVLYEILRCVYSHHACTTPERPPNSVAINRSNGDGSSAACLEAKRNPVTKKSSGQGARNATGQNENVIAAHARTGLRRGRISKVRMPFELPPTSARSQSTRPRGSPPPHGPLDPCSRMTGPQSASRSGPLRPGS